VKRSESVEVVIRLVWTREERIGKEQSSWLVIELLFEQKSIRSMDTQGDTVAEQQGKETMSVCFLKSSGRARVQGPDHMPLGLGTSWLRWTSAKHEYI
jgi:hypothetical protein